MKYLLNMNNIVNKVNKIYKNIQKYTKIYKNIQKYIKIIYK